MNKLSSARNQSTPAKTHHARWFFHKLPGLLLDIKTLGNRDQIDSPDWAAISLGSNRSGQQSIPDGRTGSKDMQQTQAADTCNKDMQKDRRFGGYP
jgi:hypothetical protein